MTLTSQEVWFYRALAFGTVVSFFSGCSGPNTSAPQPDGDKTPTIMSTDEVPGVQFAKGSGGTVNTPSNEATPVDGYETQVFNQTNAFRVKNGLRPLRWNAKLAQAAQGYAEKLAAMGYLSHTGSDGSYIGDRLASTGYQSSTWGENIANGYATPGEVMRGWLGSLGHYANIMNSAYREIGVGYSVARDRYGRSAEYWVQDFGSP